MKRRMQGRGLVFAWAIGSQSSLSTVSLLPPAKQEHTRSPPARHLPGPLLAMKPMAQPGRLCFPGARGREWGKTAESTTGAILHAA